MELVEGSQIILNELGWVILKKVYTTGAAIVEDVDGKRWLLSQELLADNGFFLYPTEVK